MPLFSDFLRFFIACLGFWSGILALAHAKHQSKWVGSFFTSRHGHQDVEDSFLGGCPCPVLNFLELLSLHHPDCRFHQIPDDRLHISAYIAYLGKLGGLHFDERSVGQFGQTSCYLCFADAGRTDHQNIFRHDFIPQFLGKQAPAVAVAQCHSHCPFGFFLPYYVFVEMLHNFFRSQLHCRMPPLFLSAPQHRSDYLCKHRCWQQLPTPAGRFLPLTYWNG